MTENRLAQIAAGSEISGNETVRLLRAAISVQAYRFARNLANHWLSVYPGDLPVDTLHAQALMLDGREDLSLPILKRVVSIDPEYLPAQRLLASFKNGNSNNAVMELAILGETSANSPPLPKWAELLSQARLALEDGMVTISEQKIHQALQLQPPSSLVAVLHLKLALREYDILMQQGLAEHYLQTWPACLVCQLALADILMQNGQENRAINLLQKAVTVDSSAQVAERLWGKTFAYRSLWPIEFKSNLPLPIPADVASALGWNQIEAGEQVESHKGIFKRHKKSREENQRAKKEQELKKIQGKINRIAERAKMPHAATADARYPIYVMFTTRDGLVSQYGQENAAVIDKALRYALTVCRNMPHWDAALVYADDYASTKFFGLQPVQGNDPWTLKNFLKDLDEALRKRGEMIGALLIVGGPQVIPFHRLPNPLDDADVDVASDNPYATSDENYFIPSWPVGRLPGSKGSDPQPLINQINNIARNRGQKQAAGFSLSSWLVNLLRQYRQKQSFGYTAEVWRRASNSVYRPIGNPDTMVISPPTGINLIGKYQKQGTKLAYYNLHGLEDGSEWYGQRDPLETPEGEDYPVALRPQDVVNSGRAPEIVYSEACYGAHIEGKGIEDAISLKFLASGTQAMVGSTSTSYGSITTPLISADLLGKLFWNYLQEGYPAGPALQRAKIELARQMDSHQGYLDGEDQKTLISFILYGDPLAQAGTTQAKAKLTQRLLPNVSQMNIVCDRTDGGDCSPQPISKEVMAQVKGVVQHYLPGMSGARVTLSHEHVQCSGHNCPTHQMGKKLAEPQLPTRRVVTLSKHVTKGNNTHTHYARITFNKEGKVVKLAVSR